MARTGPWDCWTLFSEWRRLFVCGETSSTSYGDYRMIISDNASTDATEEICRDYQAKDARITYFRQPVNIGATPNHNWCFEQSDKMIDESFHLIQLYRDPSLVQVCASLPIRSAEHIGDVRGRLIRRQIRGNCGHDEEVLVLTI